MNFSDDRRTNRFQPTKTPKRVDSGKSKAAANGTKSGSKKKSDSTATPASGKASKRKTGQAEEEDTPAQSKKSKKDKSESPSTDKPAPRPLSLAEEKERRSKEVLYCRHRLQKSLLTTNKTPVTEVSSLNSNKKTNKLTFKKDISQIHKYFQTLENYPNLEVSIIQSTKVNKVLKAIIKLQSIPHDSEYNFKSRALKLLDVWNQILLKDPPEKAEFADLPLCHPSSIWK